MNAKTTGEPQAAQHITIRDALDFCSGCSAENQAILGEVMANDFGRPFLLGAIEQSVDLPVDQREPAVMVIARFAQAIMDC